MYLSEIREGKLSRAASTTLSVCVIHSTGTTTAVSEGLSPARGVTGLSLGAFEFLI